MSWRLVAFTDAELTPEELTQLEAVERMLNKMDEEVKIVDATPSNADDNQTEKGTDHMRTTIEAGWTVELTTMHIAEGVKLEVHNGETAALTVGDALGIDFLWTPEAAAMFSNIEGKSAIELLGLVAKLNRMQEADMLAARQAHQNKPQPDWDCLTLEDEPALEPSLDGMVYRTTANDEDGSRYIITWTPDVSGSCDWDNPSQVLAI